jgi:hypothetical protein
MGRGDSAEQLIRSLAVPPAPLNSLLAGLIRLEQALSGLFDRTPFPGASLWFALRKDSGSGVERPAAGSGSQGPEELRIHA